MVAGARRRGRTAAGGRRPPPGRRAARGVRAPTGPAGGRRWPSSPSNQRAPARCRAAHPVTQPWGGRRSAASRIRWAGWVSSASAGTNRLGAVRRQCGPRDCPRVGPWVPVGSRGTGATKVGPGIRGGGRRRRIWPRQLGVGVGGSHRSVSGSVSPHSSAIIMAGSLPTRTSPAGRPPQAQDVTVRAAAVRPPRALTSHRCCAARAQVSCEAVTDSTPPRRPAPPARGAVARGAMGLPGAGPAARWPGSRSSGTARRWPATPSWCCGSSGSPGSRARRRCRSPRAAAIAPPRSRWPAASRRSARSATCRWATCPGRLYVPTDAEPNGPILLFFHGGGWIYGDLDSHDADLPVPGRAVRRAGAVGRLPAGAGAPVPGGLRRRARVPTAGWSRTPSRSAPTPRRLAVGGDSAGGTLAATTAIAAAHEGLPLAFQLLVYPGTDMRGGYRAAASCSARASDLTTPFMDLARDSLRAGPGAVARTRGSRRCWPTSPTASRRRTSPRPASTRCATRGRPTPASWPTPGVTVELKRFPDQIHGFFNIVGRGPHRPRRQRRDRRQAAGRARLTGRSGRLATLGLLLGAVAACGGTGDEAVVPEPTALGPVETVFVGDSITAGVNPDDDGAGRRLLLGDLRPPRRAQPLGDQAQRRRSSAGPWSRCRSGSATRCWPRTPRAS